MPSAVQLCVAAISGLKERGGSSKAAIRKHVQAALTKKNGGAAPSDVQLTHVVQTLNSNHKIFVQIKGKFILNAQYKLKLLAAAPPRKKVAKKATAAKPK